MTTRTGLEDLQWKDCAGCGSDVDPLRKRPTCVLGVHPSKGGLVNEALVVHQLQEVDREGYARGPLCSRAFRRRKSMDIAWGGYAGGRRCLRLVRNNGDVWSLCGSGGRFYGGLDAIMYYGAMRARSDAWPSGAKRQPCEVPCVCACAIQRESHAGSGAPRPRRTGRVKFQFSMFLLLQAEIRVLGDMNYLPGLSEAGR